MASDDKAINIALMSDQQYEAQFQEAELGGKEDKTFVTGLPQTQSELEKLSVDSADYQVRDFIIDLFIGKKCSKAQA